MAFHIRNSETERLTRELANQAKLGLAEAVDLAVRNELARRKSRLSFSERTAAIRQETAKRVKHPEQLDKAFFDELTE